MTTTEAAFSSTARDAVGNLHTIRGDNFDEFAGNIVRALGDDAGAGYLAQFNAAFGGNVVASAVATVQAAGLAAPPVSTVGQPLPQPGAVAQPVAPATPAGLPPTVTHPGMCAHGGAYVYKDSVARGKPWRRFECAVPWSQGVQGRCKPINIEG